MASALAAVIGAIGVLSGLTLGVSTCVAIAEIGIPLPREYYISRLPVEMNLIEVLVVSLAAFGICLAATLYPSWEASRMRPVEGLRHG